MDLKALDTAIAMIIVLLVLSLIVQSIQAVIKKWFKLKSRSIFNSLTDLIKYVDGKDPKSAEKTVGLIKNELKEIGRVSLIRKNPMVDSIAKEDLLRILDKIGSGPLKEKVEPWFDTVMQSFEERYARHMKTVALCVSAVLVIYLNANFFQVYHNISTNDLLRNAIIEKQDEIKSQLRNQPPQGTPDTTEQLKTELKQLQKTLDQSTSFGFSPLRRQQISDFFSGEGVWKEHRDERFQHAVRVLGGWAIMIMLLSVGAPFWQDALESLFGIKNLIRKKSETRNVEDTGGQPKP